MFRLGPWSFDKLPGKFKDILTKTAESNPDYTIVYFDDATIDPFIQTHFPQYWEAYDSLIPSAYRADLQRLLLLYKFGGIYNDLAHQYLVSVSSAVTAKDEFVGVAEEKHIVPHGLYNAFIATHPKHELIKYMIDTVIANINGRHFGNSPLDITGPDALGKAFHRFFGHNDYNAPIKQGNYVENGYRLHIYYFDKYDDMANVDKHHIVDETGARIIKTKFPDYFDVMYKNNNRPHYDEQWHRKEVFKEPASS